MTRHVLTVDLRDDPAAVEAYTAHHREVWPEVLESLRNAGVKALDIYLTGRRLVMIVETEEADVRRVFAAHVASTPRVAQWEALMKALQQPAPGAEPDAWWAVMEPVFHLEPENARTPAAR